MSEYQEHLDRIAKARARIVADDNQRAAVAAMRAAERHTGGSIPVEELLVFEEANPARSGRKEEAIRVTFGISAARYYQQLNAAIDTPHALELNPMLVNRLLARRDRHTNARASRSSN